MIKKYENNPVIKPSDVNPSLDGYKVVGAFNPGATTYGGEIILWVAFPYVIPGPCVPPVGTSAATFVL